MYRRLVAMLAVCAVLAGLLPAPTPASAATGDLWAIAYGNGMYVAVGEGGAIKTSSDGENWTGTTVTPQWSYSDVAYGNGLFVAVGDKGSIINSENGSSWSPADSDVTDYLVGVIYQDGKFTAVGGNGAVTTSTDGVAWTSQSSGTSRNMGQIAYGNGLYVAVSSDAILTSSDGITWSEQVLEMDGASIVSVSYGKGMFVAVGGYYFGGGSSVVMTSADGAIWTRRGSGEATSIIYDVAYGSGNFMAVGKSGVILVSENGIDWDARTAGTLADLKGIIFANGKFTVAGSGGAIISPNETSNWTHPSSTTSSSLRDIVFGNGMFAATGEKGAMLTSTDGINWSSRDIGDATQMEGVAYGNSRFVAVGYGDKIVTSDDGITWTDRSGECCTYGVYYDVLFADDKFVAAYAGGVIKTSEDGITWTEHESGTSSPLRDLAYGNGVFIGVGADGSVVTSADGETWTKTYTSSAGLVGVAYGNGMFVAAGDFGTLLTSSDGITWTKQSSGIRNLINGITYGKGKFVAVGDDGAIVSSANGVSWGNMTWITANHLNGIAYGNGRYAAVGAKGTIVQYTVADLNALTSSAGTLNPAFDKGVYRYSVSVANGVDRISLSPTVEDAGATVSVNDMTVTSGTASGEIALNVGNNPINIEVTTADGRTKQKYVVTVNRAAQPNTNTSLSDLILTSNSPLSPAFAPGIHNYQISVPYNADPLMVIPGAGNAGATIKVNGKGVQSGGMSEAIALNVGETLIIIEVTAADGVNRSTYTVTVTRAEPPSTDASLGSLTLSDGIALSPTFAPGTIAYTASVDHDVNTMTITPVVANAKARLQVYGGTVASGAPYVIALREGNNPIPIRVTAEDGKTATEYMVTVTRAAAPPSTDASLRVLSFAAGGPLNPNFAPGTLNYTMNVDYDMNDIIVAPIAADSGATILINGITNQMDPIPLTVGDNVLTIEVTAADRIAKQTYKVTVTRAAPPLSGNADLSSLTFSSGVVLDKIFTSDMLYYNASAAYEVNTLSVTPTVADGGATVKVNDAIVSSGTASDNITLIAGVNPINIEVTAANGLKRTYTVWVKRAEVSANASLSNLTLSGGVALSPAFEWDTISYTADVPNDVSTLTVTPTVSAEGAKVTVKDMTVASGAESDAIPLDVGANTIPVAVTSADGTITQIYTVTVTRADSFPSLSNLVLSGGAALDPVFDPATTDYVVYVPHSQTSLTVTPTAADAGAMIIVEDNFVESGTESGEIALKVGINSILVLIVSADGNTTQTYLITVVRASTSASTNANLSSLTLSEGAALNPAFASGRTNYTVSVVNGISSLMVMPTAADAGASVKVNDAAVTSVNASAPIVLNEGINIIEIVVTAADGTTMKTYTVAVTRAAVADPSPSPSVPTSPSNEPIVSGNGQLTLPVGKSGVVSKDNTVKLIIPSGAAERELKVEIEKVLDTEGLLTDKESLASSIYEITKNFAENFDKPITLTFAFDPGSVKNTEKPVIYYFDETKKQWIEIGGVVTGSEISVQVDHFTKFAVFVVDKEAMSHPEADFSDIAGNWAESNIKLAASLGLVKGYDDGTFKPGKSITRAEFSVMLVHALKLPEADGELTFTDTVKIGSWAREAVARAVEAGIIKGYADGSFRPNAEITRMEMAAMIANALKLTIPANAVTGFADDGAIPAWVKGAVAAIKELGLMKGTDENRFNPLAQATRAEAVTVLIRMLEELNQKSEQT
ncbi:cadherin-like beta sandwich domain-containing protein [Paenibacillus sp. 2TAB23]|uniref:cadherin-like beta sandwich domain-containing protein n=1 Tax=Paenibacillus sp. 2TAB23 TaxID=3233004 RepID=UPI003F9D4666